MAKDEKDLQSHTNTTSINCKFALFA